MADEPAPPESGNESSELEGESLDAVETKPGDGASSGVNVGALPGDASEPAPTATPPPGGLLARLRRRFNVYSLLFMLVLVVAAVVILVAFLQSRKSSTTNHFQTATLNQKTLDQLANGDVTVGSNQSVLNVQSSAVFAGQVLLRQSVQVAGNLQVGGTTALNGLTVAGASQFGQVTVNKNLAVAGDSAVQGGQTIAKSLQVSGGGSFGGPLSAPQLTTGSLQLNGDLVLTHHITAGGATPGHNNGSALGSGGSASLSGSDTAGSIAINTGGAPAAGCFISVNFTAHYNATPHVLVTPVGSAAGGLSYYINRSTTGFSVCDASAPPGGSSFGFDYFVLD